MTKFLLNMTKENTVVISSLSIKKKEKNKSSCLILRNIDISEDLQNKAVYMYLNRRVAIQNLTLIN